MRKIYIGSTNKAKVEAVSSVFINHQLIAKEVSSQVSNQPKSDTETRQGALNRALALPSDGLRIGLEGGIDIIDDTLYLVNWGVLIDERERIYYASGTRIPLLEQFRDDLLSGSKELAEVIDEYTKQEDNRSYEGTVGILTAGEVLRSDIFVHITKLLYGQLKFSERK